MTRPIRILHLEDSPRDAELIQHQLEVAGIRPDIVLADGKDTFEAALARESFDLILTDFNLPDYDGISGIRRARERQPDTPVIVISGTMGEEEAVRCLHEGAADYVIKGRSARLPAAVTRALNEATEHRTRLEAEARLHKSEHRFRQLAELSHSCFWFVDVQSEQVVYVSPAVQDIWGLPPEKFYQDPRLWLAAIHPDDRMAVHAAWELCVNQQALEFLVEYRVVRPDGSVRWVEDHGVRIDTEGGDGPMMTGIATDITRRKLAERAVQESLERLRLAQQAGHIGVFDYDYRNGTDYWSPELEALYGLSAGQFAETSADWIERVHPEDRAEVGRQTALARESGEYGGEFRIIRPDGGERWIFARGQVLRDERGQPTRMMGVNVDITERKQLEAQFRQAQKMELVGQLAGGIAHDFNNLLTVINGVAELAIQTVREGDPLSRDLQEIRRAGERAAALTRQLLAFSRRQIVQPQVLNLNTVVEEMGEMLRRLLGEDVDLVVVPTQGLGRVRADPGQIEQVLTNVAVNARDAMPRGGQMTIEVQPVEIGEQYGHQHGAAVRPGPYVMLAISDTGMGMDEATRKQIFEPFFTTKGPEKGTGLGLSTVYGIVKQSGGFIWVYSEVGQGTIFKIYLPQAVDEVSPKRSRPDAPSPSGTETILVVEDMAGLRHLATRMLESAGYTVLSAANGEEALRLLERDAQPVHLVLTDVVMPGMGGRTLAERLQTVRPEARVLYISGYTDDVVVRHGVLDEQMPFLSKPFTAMQLTRKVREVLDAQDLLKAVPEGAGFRPSQSGDSTPD